MPCRPTSLTRGFRGRCLRCGEGKLTVDNRWSCAGGNSGVRNASLSPPCCTTFGWRLAVIFFGNLFVSYDIAASAGIVN
jgi:hypothetical protein